MFDRILWISAALLMAVVGLFFLAAAVVAGIVIAAVVLVRLWWLKRKLGKVAEQRIITTEYTVVERNSPPSGRLAADSEQHRPADRHPGTGGNPES